ncbi:MAG: tape measure protein [bacterium]
MAIRELFAKFDFSFDLSGLTRLTAASERAEAKIRQLAGATNAVKAPKLPAQPVPAAPTWPGILRDTRAATAAGASAADLRQGLQQLQSSLAAAARGDKVLSDAFAQLGMSAKRAADSGRSSSSVWQEVVGRLSRVESSAERATLAMALLGRQGAQAALPVAAQGPQGLRIARRLAAQPVAAPVIAQQPPVTPWQRFVAVLRQVTGAERQAAVAARQTGAALQQTAHGARQAGGAVAWYHRHLQSGQTGMIGSLLTAAFWQTLATSILQAGARVAGFVASAAAGASKAVAETVLWADATRKALGAMSGFSDESLKIRRGNAEFEKVRSTAVKLGLDVIQTTDAYKKMRAVGMTAQEALDFTKLTADMQQGLGMTTETVGRMQLAISQIKGAGVLQGDELRQLQETGINVGLMWDSIAAQMGVTVAEAKKLKEEGKVTADVALKAVKAGILGTLGTTESGEAAGKLASSTLRGMFSLLKATAQDTLIDLSDTLTPEFEHLAGLIGGTLGRFDEDGSFRKAIQAVTRFATDFVQIIGIHWPRIERIFAKVLGGSTDALNETTMGLDLFVDRVLTAVEWVVDNWETVTTTFKTAAGIIVAALTAIGVSAVVNAARTTAAMIASAVATAQAWAGSGIVTSIASIGGAGIRAAATAATAMVSAARVSAAAWAPVAAAVAAVAAAVAGVLLAVDQAQKLYREIDGDLGNIFKDYGAVGEKDDPAGKERQRQYWARKRAEAGKGGEGLPNVPQNAPWRLAPVHPAPAKPTAPMPAPNPAWQMPEPVVSVPQQPQWTMPTVEAIVQLPPAARAQPPTQITLTDQRRIDVSVQAGATPAQQGRTIAAEVNKTLASDLRAHEAALIGAANAR